MRPIDEKIEKMKKELQKRGFKVNNPEYVKIKTYKDNVLETKKIFFRIDKNSEEAGEIWVSDSSPDDSYGLGMAKFEDELSGILKHLHKKVEISAELNKIVYKLYNQ